MLAVELSALSFTSFTSFTLSEVSLEEGLEENPPLEGRTGNRGLGAGSSPVAVPVPLVGTGTDTGMDTVTGMG